MYHVYILKSRRLKWNYVGFTKNINQRLTSHNRGHNKSTKGFRPFDLVFVQITKSKLKARNLEKFLKVKFNKESILEIIK